MKKQEEGEREREEGEGGGSGEGAPEEEQDIVFRILLTLVCLPEPYNGLIVFEKIHFAFWPAGHHRARRRVGPKVLWRIEKLNPGKRFSTTI